MPKMAGKKPGMPYAGSQIAQYISKQIDALQGIKTQREIAAEIGYDKANIISMFKRGEMRVPLDKIPALATSLNVDAAFLFRLAMLQYWPDRADTVTKIFGTIVTQNEAAIIERIRELTNNTDPALTDRFDKALTAALKSVVI